VVRETMIFYVQLRRSILPLACLILLFVSPLNAQSERFDCLVDPALVIKLGSPVSGVLEEVLVARGDMVEKGQLVARVNSDVQRAEVDINRLRANSKEEIDAQIARIELVKKELERTKTLFEKKVATGQKMDELRAQLEVGLQDLERLKVQRRLARLELERAERLLAQRAIYSPIDGIVSDRVLSGGEFVHEQSHILIVAQLDPLLVEAFLPAEFYQKVRLGMKGSVRIESAIEGTFDAKITIIDRVFEAASETFGIVLEMPNPDNGIPAGQVCKLSFPEVQ
jgi:RND family efflux transporter MFP subunit